MRRWSAVLDADPRLARAEAELSTAPAIPAGPYESGIRGVNHSLRSILDDNQNASEAERIGMLRDYLRTTLAEAERNAGVIR
jgi:hypothetical protein